MTFDRLLPLVSPRDVWVCTARELGDAVRRELPEVPPEQILLEPAARNTAPAIAWSLACMPPERRSDVVVSLHSDHWMEDEDRFRRTLSAAVEEAAARPRVIALGVRPRWPETGYGYLEVEERIAEVPSIDALHRVVCFREKPDAATAAAFVGDGRHLWNAGIFVFPGELLFDALRRFEPAIAGAVSAAAADPSRLDAIYPGIPSSPIDTAVMERLDELATAVLDCGWSDLGSWEALAETMAALEPGGNAERGQVVAVDAEDNLLWAEDGVIAVLGVSGLAVVKSGDAVLVVPKERSQEVRRIVEELARRRWDEQL
jgi:mannose-1-phosphate guanylyltransferase